MKDVGIMKDVFAGLKIIYKLKGNVFDSWEVSSENKKRISEKVKVYFVGNNTLLSKWFCTCVYGSWYGNSKRNLKLGRTCRHIKFVQERWKNKMVSVPDEKLPCPKCNNKLNFLLNDGVKNMVEAECKNCGAKWEYVDDSTFECSDIGEEICPHCETAHIEFNKGIGA